MVQMSEKTLVVQHNALIEARYKMTIEEQRIIKTIISQINSKDEDFKLYEIRVLDLAKLIGVVGDSYYSRIKSLLSKLRKSTLLIADEHGDPVETGWVSSITYRQGKGTIALRFDPVLKPYLLQLKRLFTPYELGNILRLKGMYSIRIFELLKQYEKIGQREFSLHDLKKVLSIDSEYAQYRDFKKYVLLPAEKEISLNTDITFSIEEKKQGRKVIGLIFFIKGKNNKETDTYTQVIEQTSTRVDSEAIQNETTEAESEYVRRLVDVGVTRAVAVQLVADYDGERIELAFTVMQINKAQGIVKNPAAFIVVAIQRDFTDPKAQERAKGAELVRLHAEREKLRKGWEEVKAQYGNWKVGTVEALLLGMTEAEAAEEKRIFSETLKGPMENIYKKNKEAKWRHFVQYMAGRLNVDTLEVWAEKNGVDLAAFPEEIRNK